MKKLFLAMMCATMVFGLQGCGGGSKAPKVEKKEKAEYSGKEVQEQFEKKAYKTSKSKSYSEDSESYISISKDYNSPAISATTSNGKIVYIFYTDGENNYLIDASDETKDAAMINTSDKKLCVFYVESQETDPSEVYECDKTSIENGNSVYKSFYEFLNQFSLNREELVNYLTWAKDNI